MLSNEPPLSSKSRLTIRATNSTPPSPRPDGRSCTVLRKLAPTSTQGRPFLRRSTPPSRFRNFAPDPRLFVRRPRFSDRGIRQRPVVRPCSLSYFPAQNSCFREMAYGGGKGKSPPGGAGRAGAARLAAI